MRVDHPPTAAAASYSVLENGTLTVNGPGLLALASDPDGDPLTASVATGPAHGSLTISANGRFVYTPAANYSGPDSFMYRVSDGYGGTATAMVTLTVVHVNQPPTFTLNGNPPASAENAGPQTVPNFARNISPGPNEASQTVHFVVTGNSNPGLFSAGPAISPSGTLTYTAAPNASGTATITVVLQDDGGTANGGQDTSPPQTFVITVTPVNQPPTIDPIPDVNTTENFGTISVNLTGITAGAGDNQALQVTAASSNPAVVGDPTVVYTSPNSTGTLTFTSNPNVYGSATITVTVRDAGLDGVLGDADDGITSETFTFNVAQVLQPPVAMDDSYSYVPNPLNPSLTIPAPGVLANDSDPQGGTLTVSGTLVTGPSLGTVVMNADGSFTYTPFNSLMTGTDTFQYQVTDSAGLSAVATVTIHIGQANRPPTAMDDSASTPEGTVLNGTSVLANDSDPDGDPLTAALVTGPAHGTLTLHPDGTYVYTPAAGFSGTDTFTYQAVDSQGAMSAPATVTITVVHVNQPPVAVNDSATTAENSPVTIDVLANDSDPDGDPLTIIGVTQGANGTVAVTASGVLYTPTAGFAGTDTFTYTISDGNGGTATATVTVTVTGVNQPPTAVDDTATIPENSAATIDVLANDSDPDGDPLTIIGVGGAAHGTVTTNGATVFYTPAAGFYGTDTFTYTISDGNGGTATATVTVNVLRINNPPTAVDDNFTTAEDTPLGGNVLANDSDPDGDPLSAILVTGPAHGTLVLNADGTFTYTPSANYNGADSFTYRAFDGQTTSGVATVTITVTPVDDPPVITSDGGGPTASLTVPENTTFVTTVTATDIDSPPSSLVFSIAGGADAGLFTIDPATGVLRFRTPPDYEAPADANHDNIYVVTVRVDDGAGGFDTQTISITVVDVNEPPTRGCGQLHHHRRHAASGRPAGGAGQRYRSRRRPAQCRSQQRAQPTAG